MYILSCCQLSQSQPCRCVLCVCVLHLYGVHSAYLLLCCQLPNAGKLPLTSKKPFLGTRDLVQSYQVYDQMSTNFLALCKWFCQGILELALRWTHTAVSLWELFDQSSLFFARWWRPRSKGSLSTCAFAAAACSPLALAASASGSQITQLSL